MNATAGHRTASRINLRGARHWASLAASLATVVLVALSCSNSIGPEDVSEIRLSAGNGQTADAGTQVPVRPAVKAVAKGGEPVPGLTISFAVAEGGGSVSPGSATTDRNGIASTQWTLGTAPGSNVLTASTERLTTRLTFSATGVVGAPAIAEPRAGDGQSATAGRPVNQRLSVTVTDQVGNPVAGVPVTWAVATGGGQISGANTITGSSGAATLTEWILGPDPGPNTVTATPDGVPAATFTATGVPGPALVNVFDGGGQTGEAGTALPIPPTVQVVDARGNPFGGVEVQFVVSAGGGSVSSPSVIADDNGLAAVQWTLGPAVGTNTLFVQVGDLPLVSFDATGVAGPPAMLPASSGDGQSAQVGSVLPVPPAVQVQDAFGNPVAGEPVLFTVTGGGGSLTGASAVSDASGIAAALSWTLGPDAGPNTVDAVVAGLPPTTFTATGLSFIYDVDLRILSALTSSQRQAFNVAVARWEQLVVGDLPDVSFSPPDTLPPDFCGITHPEVTETVDDVLIFVEVVDVDGPGGVLATAGPCVLRDMGNLTIIGVMRFDDADLQGLENSGRLDDVVLHEIAHIIGFGTLWNDFGLLQNPSLPTDIGADTHFSGPLAITAFDNVGGAGFIGGSKVPVENLLGGQGTRDSHWRESVFDSELLTGFVDAEANPLSSVTVESLADIGYTVNSAAADPYTLPLAAARAAAARGPQIDLRNDIWRGPLYRVDPDGRVVAVIAR